MTSLEEAFEGADTVYHVAGVVDISGTKDKQVWDVNVGGTKNVVQACKKMGVKTLIYVSSVDAVPMGDGDGELKEISAEPATEEEAANTVKVMGGEDWQLWINQLSQNDVLAEGCITVAYSYIGPEATQALYRNGTIGKAKEHLEATALTLDKQMSSFKGRAFVSVNKGLVTKSSAVIPVIPSGP